MSGTTSMAELCSQHMEKVFVSKEIIEQFIPMSLDYMKQLLDVNGLGISKLKYGFDDPKLLNILLKLILISLNMIL